MTGNIEKIEELTKYGMHVKLDNGVSVWINFNDSEVNLNFSGISYDHGMGIREANLVKTPLRLGNCVTVEYKPRMKD